MRHRERSLKHHVRFFIKKSGTLIEAEKRFTVVKDNYQIGIVKQEFSPYTGTAYKFKSGDSPILTFFLKGAKMVQKNPPWDLDAIISILKGEENNSSIQTCKTSESVFLPARQTYWNEECRACRRQLFSSIDIVDNNMKGLKGKVILPFDVIK